MGRKSLKESRQEEIIIAFYKVSKKIGLENTSIAKIADHMDINPSLILHYFKTKEALYSGLIRFILERYRGIYKTGPDGIKSHKELYQLINNLFSRKWNDLIDDGVFYSCYALVYRDTTIRRSFKVLHDSLRNLLVKALQQANENGIIEIENEQETAEIIFALTEGAYYYLGMVRDKKLYNEKLTFFKNQALAILRVPVMEEA